MQVQGGPRFPTWIAFMSSPTQAKTKRMGELDSSVELVESSKGDPPVPPYGPVRTKGPLQEPSTQSWPALHDGPASQYPDPGAVGQRGRAGSHRGMGVCGT